MYSALEGICPFGNRPKGYQYYSRTFSNPARSTSFHNRKIYNSSSGKLSVERPAVSLHRAVAVFESSVASSLANGREYSTSSRYPCLASARGSIAMVYVGVRGAQMISNLFSPKHQPSLKLSISNLHFGGIQLGCTVLGNFSSVRSVLTRCGVSITCQTCHPGNARREGWGATSGLLLSGTDGLRLLKSSLASRCGGSGGPFVAR
jgi:hypothetical protein